jgi:hypothetical protein
MSATENIMTQLKKDWDDLAARSQVSEVGLDVDRAKLIDRYRNEEGLTQKQIGECVGLGQQHVSYLLVYHRFMFNTSTGRIEITERTFRAYWKQIADPKMTRGRKGIDPEYEATCFDDIRKLVEAGTPPLKQAKKEKLLDPAEMKKGMTTFLRDVKKFYRKKIHPQVERLKRLRGCDRSTYAPALLADVGEAIEEAMNELLTLVAAASNELSDHSESSAANPGK